MTDQRSLADVLQQRPSFNPESLSVAEAAQIIDQLVTPVGAIESLALRDTLGRIAAVDVLSTLDVPAHDNSAMDGFSVRSADLRPGASTTLRVVGAALAGRPFLGSPQPGEAVRVMTGALMPFGHDTVIVQEVVQVQGEQITVPPGQLAGQNRRLRGEDLSRGSVAIPSGRQIGPAELGLLASLGIAELKIRRRLRVAFFSTGDELRSIGEPLAEGQIYDSNRYTLFGMLRRLGVEGLDLGVVPDDPAALERTVAAAAASADVVVSSAGVSVGEADFTRSVMGRLGEVGFWKIAMRPGRPLAFGKIGQALYFGLPGNPVAVMITFLFLVRPALIKLAGGTANGLTTIQVRAAQPIRKRPGRTEYQRGAWVPSPTGEMTVQVMANQGSGVLSSMAQADCIVVLAHERPSIDAGEFVDCVPMGSLF